MQRLHLNFKIGDCVSILKLLEKIFFYKSENTKMCIRMQVYWNRKKYMYWSFRR